MGKNSGYRNQRHTQKRIQRKKNTVWLAFTGTVSVRQSENSRLPNGRVNE
jgi:hypothetical protein